jgi:hypothetical protein
MVASSCLAANLFGAGALNVGPHWVENQPTLLLVKEEARGHTDASTEKQSEALTGLLEWDGSFSLDMD